MQLKEYTPVEIQIVYIDDVVVTSPTDTTPSDGWSTTSVIERLAPYLPID